jgi:aminoglycoside phosphotransferase (APT) family kinase protein
MPPARIPSEVRVAITRALGIPHGSFFPLVGGTNQRTFLLEYGERSWVTRIDPAPALSLLRSVRAQQQAQAASVRTPTLAAHAITETAEGAAVWTVESFEPGRSFDHRNLDRAATVDLGRQLRRLHQVAVDAFGDLPPRPYPVYDTFAAWASNKARRIAGAVQLSEGPPESIPAIAEVYALLPMLYAGTPRLCKGDCAGANILVAAGRVAAIIDWEWAQGLDPAADVAYWLHYTPAAGALETLLAGYEPDDPALFRRRVLAHRVVHCVETIHVFADPMHGFIARARRAGLRREAAQLAQLLAQRPWV